MIPWEIFSQNGVLDYLQKRKKHMKRGTSFWLIPLGWWFLIKVYLTLSLFPCR